MYVPSFLGICLFLFVVVYQCACLFAGGLTYFRLGIYCCFAFECLSDCLFVRLFIVYVLSFLFTCVCLVVVAVFLLLLFVRACLSVYLFVCSLVCLSVCDVV